ncbi:dithiol-disulfide isomerase [Taibaiella sp. KBW10]|nr:dithiol-disulfide isomerase [Taibaiella sp. KBW10]
MDNKTNPLLCDPEQGFCAIPDTGNNILPGSQIAKSEKSVKIIYFTDPICSSCWGIEPQLRKLKLAYGHAIDIEYRMGGLLPDWSYNSGGISKPSDVAHHWDEVSVYYDMPIDGAVWLEDPLSSSYPPSIAFKAAQMQDAGKALFFLRELREMVFLQKKNIAKWEHIEAAALKSGLDTETLKIDIAGKGKELFEADLALARDMGVRGFPTMFLINNAGNKEMIYGTKPYTQYEAALVKLDAASVPEAYGKSWKDLFAKYASLTAKEFSELSGKPRADSEQELNQLSDKGLLQKYTTKNGSLWTRINNTNQ